MRQIKETNSYLAFEIFCKHIDNIICNHFISKYLFPMNNENLAISAWIQYFAGGLYNQEDVEI